MAGTLRHSGDPDVIECAYTHGSTSDLKALAPCLHFSHISDALYYADLQDSNLEMWRKLLQEAYPLKQASWHKNFINDVNKMILFRNPIELV